MTSPPSNSLREMSHILEKREEIVELVCALSFDPQRCADAILALLARPVTPTAEADGETVLPFRELPASDLEPLYTHPASLLAALYAGEAHSSDGGGTSAGRPDQIARSGADAGRGNGSPQAHSVAGVAPGPSEAAPLQQPEAARVTEEQIFAGMDESLGCITPISEMVERLERRGQEINGRSSVMPNGQLMLRSAFYIKRLAALLHSQLPAEQHDAGWRDIASAPKDGTQVLYWSAQYGAVAGNELPEHARGHWSKGSGGSADWRLEEATHWRPLPSPPQGGRADGE